MQISFNWFLILLVPVIAGCGSGGDNSPKSPPPERALPLSLLRVYCAGTTRLAADTNAAPWVSMSQLPASQALWRQTLEKLARAPHQMVYRRTAATNDYADVFQELIADFVRAESFVEIVGDSNRVSEYELAARLPADRAEYWRTNLLTILQSWTGQRGTPLPADGAGWEMKSSGDQGIFRLSRSGAWTLLGWGTGQLPLHDEYRKRIANTGRPALAASDSWLEVFCDGPNLSTIPGHSGTKELPVANFALTPRGSDLRLGGNLIVRDPFSWQLEPWQIPTNLIREPIISFTAMQGVASRFKAFQDSLELPSGMAPNQLFVWAGDAFPVQTLAAAPMPQAEKFVQNLAPKVMDRFNPVLQATGAGFLALGTNALGVATIRWSGIPPWVTPFVTSATDSGAEFLVVGTFPNWPGEKPPAEMFHYLLSRTNLVYYDWELTAAHVQSWRAIVNIFRHLFEVPRLGPETASVVWLNSVSNRLGNTITEVSRSNSNQLAFVRQGPVCLTGLELIALGYWLESPGFPLNGLALAERTNAVGAP